MEIQFITVLFLSLFFNKHYHTKLLVPHSKSHNNQNLYSFEYISSLWRNKIPKLIASAAEDDYLYWHYLNNEKGKYKKCSCCGEVKLISRFGNDSKGTFGKKSKCKECVSNKNQ